MLCEVCGRTAKSASVHPCRFEKCCKCWYGSPCWYGSKTDRPATYARRKAEGASPATIAAEASA
jgi:hypothetical protein